MFQKIVELLVIAAAVWSIAGYISERTFNGLHSTFDMLPVAYFILIWIYLFILNLNYFISSAILHPLMLTIDVVLIVSRWGTTKKKLSAFSQLLSFGRSLNDRQISLGSIKRITTASIITVLAVVLTVIMVWNLRFTVMSIDDVLTLYKPRVDLLLQAQKPLVVDASVYDSLLNSYPYGPQMMPLRLSMVINSSLALVLDTSLVLVLGIGATRLLASAIGLSTAMTNLASLFWIFSPMVLTQAGTGLTDATFACGILVTVALALSHWRSNSPIPIIAMVITFAATSAYKLLAVFYLPVLICCFGAFLAYTRRRRQSGAIIASFLPVSAFPILNLFMINNRIYGSILGDPDIRVNFSEALEFAQKINFFKINSREIIVDLLNGNTSTGGDIKSNLLGLRNPWGNGVRAIEGVVGPGFLPTLMVMFGLVCLVGILLKSVFFVFRSLLSGDDKSNRQSQKALALPVKALFLFLAGGLSGVWVIYERSTYSIATVRYVLPAILLMAVSSLSLFSYLKRNVSGRWKTGRFGLIFISVLLVGMQVQASTLVLDDYGKDGLRGPFEMTSGVRSLSEASGFMYLPDHVNLLQALDDCVEVSKVEEAWTVSRDKFPHGLYSGSRWDYKIISPSRVNDLIASAPSSQAVLVLGDQLDDVLSTPTRTTYRSGYQWLSVATDYWKC